MWLWILLGYVAVSSVLYFICRMKCKKDPIFKAPKSRAVYYILSFTWGLPTVLVGAVAALFIRLMGYRPRRYGWEWCFEIPGISWGMELGLFFISPAGDFDSIKMHEQGHGIQNIYLGVFYPTVVLIPSAVRFWYRFIRKKIGKPCRTAYSDIWFEASADKSGKTFIDICRKTLDSGDIDDL